LQIIGNFLKKAGYSKLKYNFTIVGPASDPVAINCRAWVKLISYILRVRDSVPPWLTVPMERAERMPVYRIDV
jgi:hypothetical protein